MSSGDTTNTPEFKAGDILCAGRFIVERDLGAGGVGRVYLCRDVELTTSVACKVAHQADELAWRECRLQFEKLGRIYSRDVVRAIGFHVHEDARRRPVIVMEAVDGHDFKDWAQTAPLEAKFKAIARIAGAVATLHEAGLAHGDFSQGWNVRVSSEGQRIVLIDPDSDIGQHAPQGGDRISLAGVIRSHLPEYARLGLGPALALLDDPQAATPMTTIAPQIASAAERIPLIDLSSPNLLAAAASYKEERASIHKRYSFVREQRALTISGLWERLNAIAQTFGLRCDCSNMIEAIEKAAESEVGSFQERWITIHRGQGSSDRWHIQFDEVDGFPKPVPYFDGATIAVGTSTLHLGYTSAKPTHKMEIQLRDDVPILMVGEDVIENQLGRGRRMFPQQPETRWSPLDDAWIVARFGELTRRQIPTR